MASISLDSRRPAQKHSVARNCDIPMVSNTHNNSMAVAPNISPSARLQNHRLIECIDLTAESHDRFGEPAVGGDTRVHVKGSVHRR